MKDNNLYQETPFSTYEAAEILGMGKHKDQVVGWTRRHLKPYEVDESNPKKQMMRLDLVNIFELFLIQVLKKQNLKPGKINDLLFKEQIEELLFSSKLDYLVILGGGQMALICDKPLFLLQNLKGIAILVINFQEIKRQIFEGIKKVRK